MLMQLCPFLFCLAFLQRTNHAQSNLYHDIHCRPYTLRGISCYLFRYLGIVIQFNLSPFFFLEGLRRTVGKPKETKLIPL